MCRVSVTLDPVSKVPGNHEHQGTNVNALWFDRDGDTIIVCAHPGGDITRPPLLERTLSLGAWTDLVSALGV